MLSKLKLLTAYLRSKNMVADENLDSWSDKCKMIPSSKNLGHGICICICQYQATFLLEEYNKSPDLIMVYISTWLQDNDKERLVHKLEAPDIDIDQEDDHAATVLVDIQFREEITLVEDENGVIDFNGKTWRIDDVEVTDVETGNVFANDEGAPVTEGDMPDGAMADEDEEYILVVEGDD